MLISVFVMGILIAIHMTGGVKQFLAGNFLNVGLATLFNFPIALLIIAPAFVLHEMGHKFVAQKFGFWAEYRMWTQGLLLAVFFTIMGFLFVAPGAVYFAPHGFGAGTKEKIGRVGLIGPMINIFLGVIFAAGSLLAAGNFWAPIFLVGATVNAFLAIFNLIPFPPLDGEKVFVWDKKIWFSAIALAVILFISLSRVF